MAFFGMGIGKKDVMPSAKDALPGRDKEMPVPDKHYVNCLLYTSPSPRDKRQSRMPSSA